MKKVLITVELIGEINDDIDVDDIVVQMILSEIKLSTLDSAIDNLSDSSLTSIGTVLVLETVDVIDLSDEDPDLNIG